MPKLRPYDRDLDYSYAPGIFPAHELLAARPQLARRLLVHSRAEDSAGVRLLTERAQALGVRVEVADRALERIGHKENVHAAAVFEKAEQPLAANAPHVVLVSPMDMGNLGTILRSLAGFGFVNLAITRPAADVFDPRVVRASMGALFRVNVCRFDGFDAYRAAHPDHALYPFMLDGSVTLDAAVREAAGRAPPALVFGNEAAGLDAAFAGLGTPVRIPHSDAIDSLNLSVAVSIGTYEFAQAIRRVNEGV